MRWLLLLLAIAVLVWSSLLWTAVVAVIMILVRFGLSGPVRRCLTVRASRSHRETHWLRTRYVSYVYA